MNRATSSGRIQRFTGPSPAQPAAYLVRPLAHPPAGDAGEGLEGDRAAHLGVAAHPLDELDRHLAHGQTGAQRAGDQVGLEDVAVAADAGEVELLQRLAAVEPEAG